MSVLDRLRAWWRRRSGTASTPAGAEGERAYDHECSVCGTGVEEPGEPCPLCRSSDVVPAGSTAGVEREGDSEPPTATVGTERVAAGDDASVDRLRELREEDELLDRYASRWKPVDGGFRVETDRGTSVVDSREEVVALLRAEDD